jgi:ribonuclease-3
VTVAILRSRTCSARPRRTTSTSGSSGTSAQSSLPATRSTVSTGGRAKASILSDTVEAVIGAVHLSGGFDASGPLVHMLFDPLIAAASEMGAGLDWKTSLQELSAERGLGVPEYVIQDEGPDHMKTFTAQVRVGEDLYGNGIGRSKKEAEQAAAETAYGELSELSSAASADD